MSYDQSQRWWENYLVRYLMPSIAGMIAVKFLYNFSGDLLLSYIPTFTSSNFNNITPSNLIIWALMGSVYCYISSFPILVFHATRIYDFKDAIGNLRTTISNPYTAIVFVIIFSNVISYYRSAFHALILTGTYSSFQIYRIYKCYKFQDKFLFNEGYNSSIAYAFLDKLSRRRGFTDESEDNNNRNSKKTNNKKNKKGKSSSILRDMATSYRHLREHGNSAFILLHEIALCPILLVALINDSKYGNMSFTVIVIAIWTLPAALIHLFGQHLEHRYSLFKNEFHIK